MCLDITLEVLVEVCDVISREVLDQGYMSPTSMCSSHDYVQRTCYRQVPPFFGHLADLDKAIN